MRLRKYPTVRSIFQISDVKSCYRREVQISREEVPKLLHFYLHHLILHNRNSPHHDDDQIRDGDQGYSTEIGTFCGSDFPPIITSSSRSLWLRSTCFLTSNISQFSRFVSDATIEYGGFKAVYDYIPNPLETLPLIAKCEFELGGPMGYLGGSILTL